MTLPAFAAGRECLQEISIGSWYAAPAAIDRPAPALSSKPDARHCVLYFCTCATFVANKLHRELLELHPHPHCCGRSTGQTDVRTPDRYIHPAPYHIRIQSKPLEWTALGPNREHPLRRSIHLSMFYILRRV